MSWRVLFCVLLAVLSVGDVAAQIPGQPKSPRERSLKIPPNITDLRQAPDAMKAQQLMVLRRRVIELDRLLALGSLSRAETLLMDLEQHKIGRAHV